MFRRPRPLPVALGLTAALGALALARSATPQYETKRAQLQAEAQARREKLHLSFSDACQKDPTPQMRFGTELSLQPGQKLHLVIPGKFYGSPGALFRRDDITVSSVQHTSEALVVDAQVSPQALPGEATLELFRELCPHGDEVRVGQVVTPTRWDVRFPNGWAVQLTCTQKSASDDTDCDAVWSGKGGPKATHARLSHRSPTHFGVEYSMTPSEEELLQKQMEKVPRDPPPELMAALKKSQVDIGNCAKLPQDKQMPCFQDASAPVQKLSDQWKHHLEEVTPPAGPPVIGCTSTSFDVQGTQVTAEGEECGKAGQTLAGGTGSVKIGG